MGLPVKQQMRRLLQLFLAFRCIFGLAYALPPVRPLAPIDDALRTAQQEAVSTELTLGRQWGTTPDQTSHFIASPVEAAGLSLPQGHVDLWRPVPVAEYPQLQDSSSVAFQTHPEQPSQPLERAEQSLAEGSNRFPSSFGSASGPFLQAQETTSTPAVAQVDTHFSHLLQDPKYPRYLRLPSQLTYVDSPWMDSIYLQMAKEVYINRPTQRWKIDVGDVMTGLFGPDKRFPFQRGTVYKIHLRENQFGSATDRELIFKFHHERRWSPNIPTQLISFWSTYDRGSRMALVGLYAIGRAQFNMIATLSGVEALEAHSLDRFGGGAWLKPQQM